MHTRLACARRNGALRLDMAARRPDSFLYEGRCRGRL